MTEGGGREKKGRVRKTHNNAKAIGKFNEVQMVKTFQRERGNQHRPEGREAAVETEGSWRNGNRR